MKRMIMKRMKGDKKGEGAILIDGSFFMYRAYYSMQAKGKLLYGPERTTIFSYTRMMMKLLGSPICANKTFCCLALDTKSNFRRDQCPSYKVGRKPMPEPLKLQLDGIVEANRGLGLPCVSQEGFEADDIIAYYAQLFKARSIPVTIISQDKDFYQLIEEPHILQYDPMKDHIIGHEEVRDKFGVYPHLMRDLQSLAGDKIDNIPGVPGIGAKTAASLLNHYGNLSEIIVAAKNNESDSFRKQLNSVRKHEEQLELSRSLVSLVEDIPGVPPIEKLHWGAVSSQSLLPFLEKFQFFGLITEFNKHHKRSGRGKRMKRVSVEGVTVVDTVAKAREVVKKLMKITQQYHAVDVETIGFDVKVDSPYARDSQIICLSIYVGPQYDFGMGSRIWIDTLEKPEILQVMKPYLEAEKIRKVWHNYSFDRAVLYRNGIDVKGFGGDTLHMARLWDASRMNKGGYSLEVLSNQLLDLDSAKKVSMKDRFGREKINKDGSIGKEILLPELDDIQRGLEGKQMQLDWIDYSTLDTEATWRLRVDLEEKLRAMKCTGIGKRKYTDLYAFYDHYWKPFGECLTDMEKEGVLVDVNYLEQAEREANGDLARYREGFKQWAQQYCEDAQYMNPGSDAQKRQFFFAPCYNKKTGEQLDQERIFKVLNEVRGEGEKKHREITISGLGMSPVEYTKSGWPGVGSESLRKLAGYPTHDPPSYGDAFAYFKGRGGAGREACEAIDALLQMGSVDTLLSSFIVPLQRLGDERNRVHASMNINTETGRLSCRRPNLQNQPSYEKDIYRIRKAFTCQPGHKLIVADYGQVELRLLAHMTDCQSMIDAFAKGGDFHSRTAVSMYDHVQKAIESGEAILEGTGSDVPLVKDLFGSERRKAKTLNFSIAYGKTAMGLAKDWGTSRKEAEDTLRLWFEDRPEVLAWQQRTIANARKTGYTETIMGRRRPLQYINAKNMALKSHAERAAINTPIQGSAADIVMAAMLKVHRDLYLKKLGYKLLLQVHDELILEGPEQHAEEALDRLINLMRDPIQGAEFLVDFVVDGDIGENWFVAK